jgi:Ca2+-binding RTX toxin-like protein
MRRVALVLAVVALALLLASGVAWAVNRIGTNGPDTLRGTNRADNLLGKGGNDILLGLGGSDNLLGGPGKDVVAGSNGGDKNLMGGRGNDALLGARGSDNVLGDEGNDLLVDGPLREFSVDNVLGAEGNDVFSVENVPAFKDIVRCGDGFDRVFADRKDEVGRDCERVADRVSEFDELAESIPQSFFEGLHPQFPQFF